MRKGRGKAVREGGQNACKDSDNQAHEEGRKKEGRRKGGRNKGRKEGREEGRRGGRKDTETEENVCFCLFVLRHRVMGGR